MTRAVWGDALVGFESALGAMVDLTDTLQVGVLFEGSKLGKSQGRWKLEVGGS